MASKSALHYRKNKASLLKKRLYNQKYKKGLIPGTDGKGAQERVKECTKANRANGTYGNGDGKDYDHADGKTKSAKANRSKSGDKWKTKKGRHLKKALKK